MKRVVLYTVVLFASLLVWFLSGAELANFISIGMVLIVGGAAVAMLLKHGYSFIWLALISIVLALMVFMIISMIYARNEADFFAQGFISRYACRPDLDVLKANPEWENISNHMIKRTVWKFGAVRVMTYQDDGLFRYGFLSDAARTVRLPVCNQ